MSPSRRAAALLVLSAAGAPAAAASPARPDGLRLGLGIPVEVVHAEAFLEALGYLDSDARAQEIAVPLLLPAGLRLDPSVAFGNIDQDGEWSQTRSQLGLAAQWLWPISPKATGGAGARLATSAEHWSRGGDSDKQGARTLGAVVSAEAWPTPSLALGAEAGLDRTVSTPDPTHTVLATRMALTLRFYLN